MSKIITFNKENIKIDKTEFTIDWEVDVLTEKKTFLYLKEKSNLQIPFDYLAYPWAFLIDMFINKFKNKFNDFYEFINYCGLIKNLNLSKNKIFITTVQSYHYYKFLDTFKKIGVKVLFSPHALKNEFSKTFQKYDLIIFPYLIYPSITGKIQEKNIFYSFIGNINYNLKKPTTLRTKLCNMNHPDNSFIKSIDKWHFDDSVYGEQLNLIKYDNNKVNKKNREEEYIDILGKSLFSICPLGIGPNSIRLSESIAFNSIPVSISDELWLPFYINVDWNKLIISIKEENYYDISNINVSELKIKEYQSNLKEFNNNYLSNNYGNLIEKAFNKKKEIILLVPWYNITDELRYEEIHSCLHLNLDNNLIKKIIFFYEVNDESQINYELYKHDKITIIPKITNKKRDITFNEMVDYCNNNFINEICAISNNDIYFDSTLLELQKIDFIKYKYFISLTRKNYGNYLDNNNQIWKPHPASQDTWIFQSPLKFMENNINLGWIQCDNIISENYHKLGYNVINPHYSINSWHLHKFNNTKTLLKDFNYNYKFKMKKVPLENLEDIIKKAKELSFSNLNIELPEFTKPNKIDIKKLSNIKKKWKNNLEINNL